MKQELIMKILLIMHGYNKKKFKENSKKNTCLYLILYAKIGNLSILMA